MTAEIRSKSDILGSIQKVQEHGYPWGSYQDVTEFAAQAHRDRVWLMKETARLSSAYAEAVEVLKLFADIEIPSGVPDERPYVLRDMTFPSDHYDLTAGDVRRARSLLSRIERKDDCKDGR